jgi:hypothetical protein
MMGDFVGAVIQPKPIPRTEVMALFLVQDIMFAERAGPIRTKTADTAILLGGPARRLDGRTDRRSEAKQERQTRKMFQSYVVFKHRYPPTRKTAPSGRKSQSLCSVWTLNILTRARQPPVSPIPCGWTARLLIGAAIWLTLTPFGNGI